MALDSNPEKSFTIRSALTETSTKPGAAVEDRVAKVVTNDKVKKPAPPKAIKDSFVVKKDNKAEELKNNVVKDKFSQVEPSLSRQNPFSSINKENLQLANSASLTAKEQELRGNVLKQNIFERNDEDPFSETDSESLVYSGNSTSETQIEHNSRVSEKLSVEANLDEVLGNLDS